MHGVRHVPEGCQFGSSLQRRAGFQCDVAPASTVGDAKARLVQRRLRIKSIINQRHHNLQMPLGLHESAHYAKWRQQAAVCSARKHAGDDGVIRAFVGRDAVGMAWV